MKISISKKRFVFIGVVLVALLSAGLPLRGQKEETIDETLKRLSSANDSYAKGMEEYKMGRTEKAEAAFESCLKKFPEHAYAHYYLANIYFIRKDFPSSLGHMEKALAQFDAMKALNARAEERKTKQRDSIRLTLEEMADSSPSCRDSRSIEMVQNLLDVDEFNREKAAARREDMFGRMKAHYVYFLGNVLFQLQRVPEAFHRYEEAVRLDPRHADAYNNLIAICFIVREYKTAQAFLERAEEQGLDESLNLDLKERLFKALGKPTEGILFEDLSVKGPARLGIRRFALIFRRRPDLARPFYVNAYIVFDPESRAAALIDPGVEDPRIEDFVRENGLSVKAVLNSHCHPDHSFANGFYSKKFGAPVFAPRDEARFYTPPPDRLLKDGDDLEFGGLTVHVVQIPGHTEGSLCFIADGAVFSGDTLFKNGIGKLGVEDAKKRGESRKKMIQAIRVKLLELPEDTLVCPGHGRTTTVGEEKANNPALTKYYAGQKIDVFGLLYRPASTRGAAGIMQIICCSP
ncbi:MAG: MBL fold metallo-hydrolase [Candidatus Aminicenantes bacterium]|nr:MBL fold metallo-hydrolase [Candidatus Aminicenantes bacterium]